jgi:aryl-alcohol dehydrogenase-like predicted oxidoreductase
MTATKSTAAPSAAAAGTLTIGGDLEVHRLGFGAMRLTGPGVWGPPPDRAGAIRVLRRALELGVNFIDTADSYGPAVSEEIIAEALHPYPPGLVIATKGGLTRSGPGNWGRDARPAHLRAACEGSLRRLRLSRIDLYQLHAVDPNVPLTESLGELMRLQKEGKIRHIGVSNVSAAELERAQRVVAVVSVQNRYNLADRGSEDVLTACEAKAIAFIPWFPLGAGRDAANAQHVLAWLLARSPVMLPIPGTSSVAHLEQNVAAAAVRLSTQQKEALAGPRN